MENYEKKYKEALAKLQEALAPCEDGCKISGLTRDCLENVFPELKESEDEWIRREIIDFLRLPHPQFVGKRYHEKWIVWLEKQDNKLDADRVIAWLVANIYDFEHYVKLFKKDFGL